MENINIGFINLVLSTTLKESFINESNVLENKTLTRDFFNVVKNSPLLQLEFKVFDNIENKEIENDLIATRYIDNNIKLFEVYTLDELKNERNKIKKFYNENVNNLDGERIKLYESINNLIIESLKNYNEIDVDTIHESFTIVLNHIKKPKKNIVENVIDKDINEEVIEIAIDKFNEKYKTLSEDDKDLLKKLVKSSDDEKQQLLESYKSECLMILENIDDTEITEEIQKGISNINEIKYSPETVDDNIIKLFELKYELE